MGVGEGLHLFHNDGDFVIAESPDEARKLAAEMYGVPVDEVSSFDLYPDGDLFHFYKDTALSDSVCKTAADWVKEHGKGYFATSEV